MISTIEQLSFDISYSMKSLWIEIPRLTNSIRLLIVRKNV